MSQFDKYFTNNDKPFAENINDALLVSNVFDYTVNIEMPTMFSDNSFIENYSPRKCGVAIVTLLSNEGLTINQDNIFGTGRLIFKIYPNFNSFGNLKSISWVAEGGINCSIEKSDGTVIVENVGNGTTLNNSNLKILQEYTVNLEFTEATLSSLTITFENQESSNRYGANVKVQSVDGLSEQLNTMNTAITNNSTLIGEKVDKVTGKGLSTNDYTDTDKEKLTSLSTWVENTFNCNGHQGYVYYRNKNKVVLQTNVSLGRIGTYSTSLPYPPLTDLYFPMMASWEVESELVPSGYVTYYGTIMVKLGKSNGKLTITLIKWISEDTPTGSFNLHLNVEYLYDTGVE